MRNVTRDSSFSSSVSIGLSGAGVGLGEFCFNLSRMNDGVDVMNGGPWKVLDMCFENNTTFKHTLTTAMSSWRVRWKVY